MYLVRLLLLELLPQEIFTWVQVGVFLPRQNLGLMPQNKLLLLCPAAAEFLLLRLSEYLPELGQLPLPLAAPLQWR